MHRKGLRYEAALGHRQGFARHDQNEELLVLHGDSVDEVVGKAATAIMDAAEGA
jgi:hypothetical protein